MKLYYNTYFTCESLWYYQEHLYKETRKRNLNIFIKNIAYVIEDTEWSILYEFYQKSHTFQTVDKN